MTLSFDELRYYIVTTCKIDRIGILPPHNCYLLTLHLCVLLGTREVAKPKPKKKPEEEEMAAATVIQPKAKAKENFFVGLIDRQLEEDSICGKVAQFFTRVNILRHFITRDVLYNI